jgi:hypothetical protein
MSLAFRICRFLSSEHRSRPGFVAGFLFLFLLRGGTQFSGLLLFCFIVIF